MGRDEQCPGADEGPRWMRELPFGVRIVAPRTIPVSKPLETVVAEPMQFVMTRKRRWQHKKIKRHARVGGYRRYVCESCAR
jgi:hypothetical protein